jgi:hypothetical protein
MTAPEIQSRVQGVVVFRRGALVTRVAEIAPAAGRFPDSVRVTGLPLAADDASFRVRVEPADGAGAAGLPTARDLRIALEVPGIATAVMEPDERSLRDARKEKAHLEALVAQTERELGRLEKLALPARPPGRRGKPPGPSPADARLALLEFLAGLTRRLTEELLDLRDRHRQAGERLREVEDRVRRASSDRRIEPHALRKTAVVGLASDGHLEAPPRALILVEYLVPGARWAPAYSLRLSSVGSRAVLAMRALVSQRTGEDWDGVRLTLSTANAQRWSELPELPSLRIGRRQAPLPRLGWRPPPSGTEELYADWDRAFAGRFREKEKSAERRLRAAPAASEDLAGEEVPLEMSVAEAGAGPTMDGQELKAFVAAAPPEARVGATRGIVPALVRRRQAAPLPPEADAQSLAPGAPEQPPPGPLRARESMLAYGSLRMPPPRSPGRGQLVVADRLALYLELLVEQRIEVGFDLAEPIGRAVRRADAGGQGLPARCRPAQADDGFDHAYEAETPADIPSDRHYHSIPVMAREGEAGLRHVCVPREAPDVFRVAELANPLPGPLLPGPADVYLDDELLVTSDLAVTPPQATLRVGLGVDQAVKVARNTLYREETTGLTRGGLSLAHEITIDVRNNLGRAVDLEVRERIPTTRKDEQEIKVELGDVAPPWQPWEPPLQPGAEPFKGGYCWRLTVPPGEKFLLRAPYTIRISARHELAGGNRRER